MRTTPFSQLTASLLCIAPMLCPTVMSHAANPPAAQTSSADARTGIQAAYDGISAAYESRNLDKFMTYFTPDYTETDTKGVKLDKNDARKHYQDQLNKIKTMHSHYTFSDPTPLADGDQVEMTMHSDGTGEKRVLFARFKGTFTNDLLVKDLWVQTPQGWRLKSRQTIQDDTKIHPG